MLTDIEDEAGTGKREAVAAAWDRVTREMAALGYHLANPAAAHIVRMPIMGASKFESGTHLLFVSERAPRSEMLAGLVAHEFSHMLLTERGHPSHDFDLLLAVAREVARDHGLRDGIGFLSLAASHSGFMCMKKKVGAPGRRHKESRRRSAGLGSKKHSRTAQEIKLTAVRKPFR